MAKQLENKYLLVSELSAVSLKFVIPQVLNVKETHRYRYIISIKPKVCVSVK